MGIFRVAKRAREKKANSREYKYTPRLELAADGRKFLSMTKAIGSVPRNTSVLTVFDAVFKLSDEGWRKLTQRRGLFFFGLAILNEVVWRSVSTDTWVTFKVFAILPISFAFALLQLRLINRYSLEDKEAQ